MDLLNLLTVSFLRTRSASKKSLDYYTAAIATFATGRFLASLACYLSVPGRIVLGISALGSLLMSSLSLPVGNGGGVLACFMLLTFFEGPPFPTISAITLRGLGRHTKHVATGLTMAISGGAIWPSDTWVAQRDHNGAAGTRCVYISSYMLSFWSLSASSTCIQLSAAGPIRSGMRCHHLSLVSHPYDPEEGRLRRARCVVYRRLECIDFAGSHVIAFWSFTSGWWEVSHMRTRPALPTVPAE